MYKSYKAIMKEEAEKEEKEKEEKEKEEKDAKKRKKKGKSVEIGGKGRGEKYRGI